MQTPSWFHNSIFPLFLIVVCPPAAFLMWTINADYHGSNTQFFHNQLQKAGVKPNAAAKVIINGIQKGKTRIFISDGRAHDILARIMPGSVEIVIRFMMKKLLKIKIR